LKHKYDVLLCGDEHTGAAGAVGADGQPGPEGSPGEAGVIGAQGATGSPGLTGQPGSQGAAGQVGDTGPAGEQLNISYTFLYCLLVNFRWNQVYGYANGWNTML